MFEPKNELRTLDNTVVIGRDLYVMPHSVHWGFPTKNLLDKHGELLGTFRRECRSESSGTRIWFRMSSFAPGEVGLPFGIMARRLFAYLMTVANASGNPLVVITHPLHFFKAFGLSWSQERYGEFTNAFVRLCHMGLGLEWHGHGHRGMKQVRVFDNTIWPDVWDITDWSEVKRGRKKAVWAVEFYEDFFRQIRHPQCFEAMKWCAKSAKKWDMVGFILHGNYVATGDPAKDHGSREWHVPWDEIISRFGSRDTNRARLIGDYKRIIAEFSREFSGPNIITDDHGIRFRPGSLDVKPRTKAVVATSVYSAPPVPLPFKDDGYRDVSTVLRKKSAGNDQGGPRRSRSRIRNMKRETEDASSKVVAAHQEWARVKRTVVHDYLEWLDAIRAAQKAFVVLAAESLGTRFAALEKDVSAKLRSHGIKERSNAWDRGMEHHIAEAVCAECGFEFLGK